MKLSPNHSNAASELLKFSKFGKGIGLHRMHWIIKQMQNPEWTSNLDVLKITGSKGKGSTSVLCSIFLSKLGLRVGLFTSPHLLRFNERIKIDGVDISDEHLSESWENFRAKEAMYNRLFPGDTFGSFEAFTAVAFDAFESHRVDAVVSEAGIGGRYDSTRPFPGRTVALTSVELEHTELLGNSTELIAYDKADLCPSGGTLIVGNIDKEIIRRLRSFCAIRSVNLLIPDSEISDIAFSENKMEFSLKCIGLDFGRLRTSLLGEHQAGNISLAVTATWNWLSRNRPNITKEELKAAAIEAISEVHWPGRLQTVHKDPLVVIDVGHTPQSMHSVALTVKEAYPETPILLLTGVSKDKNLVGILSELVPIASLVICSCPYHKGTAAEQVAEVCRSLTDGVEVIAVEKIEDAVGEAIRRAREGKMMVLVAGGLFLAIEAMIAAEGGDPAALLFA